MSSITTPQCVTDDAELAELCERWQHETALSLDTEFIRVNTFYPQLGLLQVCDGKGSYLLDPLVLSDWAAFRDILEAPGIVKVLHSCSEDLQVFQEYFDLIPGPIFDTQRAAAFLGHGYSISYQNLVDEVLNIQVEKGETRSDWLKRPLTDEQLNYAALDVAYLPDLYEHLRQSLEQRGQLAWLEDECEQMREVARQVEDESYWEDLYLFMGASWRLEREQLPVLRSLSLWRERQARKLNKPRPWVAKDADLIVLAEQQPRDEQTLRALRGQYDLSRDLFKSDPEELLEVIRSGLEQRIAADAIPVGKPLTQGQRRRLKLCQAAVKQVARETGIAPELLARKKQLTGLLLHFDSTMQWSWPEEMGSWRRELLESALREAVSLDTASPDAEDTGAAS